MAFSLELDVDTMRIEGVARGTCKWLSAKVEASSSPFGIGIARRIRVRGARRGQRQGRASHAVWSSSRSAPASWEASPERRPASEVDVRRGVEGSMVATECGFGFAALRRTDVWSRVGRGQGGANGAMCVAQAGSLKWCRHRLVGGQ